MSNGGFGDLAQHLQWHHLAIEPGARAAVAADDAPDELVLVRNRMLLEQAAQGRARAGDVDDRRDIGLVGAGAHRVGPGTAAGQQFERIDQDRLARTGLAGPVRSGRD